MLASLCRGRAGRGRWSAAEDAVNLAVASGAPIRLNSELFSAATVDDDAQQPSSYPVATAGIAAESQQRMREAAQQRARRPGPHPEVGC